MAIWYLQYPHISPTFRIFHMAPMAYGKGALPWLPAKWPAAKSEDCEIRDLWPSHAAGWEISEDFYGNKINKWWKHEIDSIWFNKWMFIDLNFHCQVWMPEGSRKHLQWGKGQQKCIPQRLVREIHGNTCSPCLFSLEQETERSCNVLCCFWLLSYLAGLKPQRPPPLTGH